LDNEGIEPTLAVQTTVEEYSTVIVLEGELDLGTVDDLQDAVDEALGAGARHVTIDCRGITFVDSSGLRCLLDTKAKAPLGVALLQPSSSLLRLLEITSLDSMLPVFNDLEALRADLDS